MEIDKEKDLLFDANVNSNVNYENSGMQAEQIVENKNEIIMSNETVGSVMYTDTEGSAENVTGKPENLIQFEDVLPNPSKCEIEHKSTSIKECLQTNINIISNEKTALEIKLKDLKEVLQDEKAKHFVELNKLSKTVDEVKQEKILLGSDLSKFHQDMQQWIDEIKDKTQVAISSIEGQYLQDSQEKRELLSEMTSMNEELNRRGETISSLKEVVSMYEKKVIELNNQQDCDLSTIKQLRDELTDRTQRLHDLGNQQEGNCNIISQLRDQLTNTSQCLQDLDNQQNVSNDTIKQLRDELAETSLRLNNTTKAFREMETELTRLREHQAADGDRLSTSTVSKVEESNRLRDVEDSFEDRYCKLKVVAAKLKKRATETQQILDSERQKWTAEKSELTNKINQLTASARNNQTLQQECDRLADELEAERKECKILRKAATDVKGSEVNLKVKLEEAQTNIEILKMNLDTAIKDRDCISQSLSAKESELEALLKEKIAEELIRKEKTREVAELEDKLKIEKEKLAGMQKAIENAKLEARKQSVISLEMQNYEKSLSDMSAQLAAEKGRVNSLEAEVQTLQDIRDSLQEQIRLLEERVQTEETRCQQSHDELVKVRGLLHQAELNVIEQEKRVSQLTERLENERASAEAATLELASLSSAIQSNTDIMLTEKQELSQQVTSLTTQLATVSSSLEQTEEELANVRTEFDKYKVRAQSVLRRHQSEGVSQAEADDVKRQLSEFKELTDTLRHKLEQSGVQAEKLQADLNTASSEREAAETRCVNLNIALAEKTKQLDKAITEHRSQKLSLDTLVHCYKSQLEEKEKAWAEQTASLTEELQALRQQLRESSPTNVSATEPPATTTSHIAIAATRTELPLLEREDGEGSEYIPEYSPRNTPPLISPKPLIPLDKLLETNDNHHEEHDHLEMEVNSLRAELERSQKRAHHQAALLADTEQDAARKEQLIAVLKKEIGRLERCIQRQPHAQNTEYLKNIVFKFVTLETGEDRLRLVPVITTLLQLSPEETQRLSTIAKGQNLDSVAGWGSYFASWK